MTNGRTRNIFVLGMDDFNRTELKALEQRDGFHFHTLLPYDYIRDESQHIQKLLDEAQENLDRFPEPVDAIIGFWDFPVTLMVAYLCEKNDLTGATLRQALICEHKYWSRQNQKEVIPDYVPVFCAVDPFAENPLEQVSIDYPFWIKPIKAMASNLGFRVNNEQDFERAIEEIRADIKTLGDPFNLFLDKVDTPSSIAHITGNYCIAEGIIGGDQCTVSGYVFDGNVHTFGVIDSVTYPDSSSFYSYEYPSRLPTDIQEEMKSVAKRVMDHMSFDNSAFNIEFFHDDGQIWLVEINTRISQSHSAIYEKVDGLPNFKIVLDIGLGLTPEFPSGKGEAAYAGKFFVRTFDFDDARVEAIPSDSVISQLKSEMPQARVHIVPEVGMRLSELRDQDSYSYELAHCYVGAGSHQQLRERYQLCEAILKPEFSLAAIERPS